MPLKVHVGLRVPKLQPNPQEICTSFLPMAVGVHLLIHSSFFQSLKTMSSTTLNYVCSSPNFLKILTLFLAIDMASWVSSILAKFCFYELVMGSSTHPHWPLRHMEGT